MIFSLIHATATEKAEQLINDVLTYDPASRAQLATLHNQVLLIDSTLPPLRLAIEPTGDGLVLHSLWNEQADTTLTGPLTSIVALAADSQQRVSFSASGVTVSGDLELLRKLSAILSELDVDWEAALANLVGDLPAHMVADAVRRAKIVGNEVSSRAKSALGEIAQEELKLNPAKNEFEQFAKAVRHIASDVDRAAARLNRIQIKREQA